MTKTKISLIGILTLVVILFALLLSSMEWQKSKEEIGLSREAQMDPLLAASLFLQAQQKKITPLSSSQDFLRSAEITLPRDSTLIIDEAALTEHKNIIFALITWVKKGGHLIYTLSPRRQQLKLVNNPIIELSGITIRETEFIANQNSVLKTPKANAVITEEEHSFSVYLAHRYKFENCVGRQIFALNTKKETEDNEKSTNKTLICEENIGDGFITFVPSISAISNDGLRHLDHGEYLLWLLGNNDNLFYLPSTQSTSWLALLWYWSWQVVILVIVFILLLMWQLSMRLGLPIEPTNLTKNLFAQHIEAVGNFLFKHQHHDTLKKMLLTDIENLVEKRYPKYKQLNVNAQAELISSLTGKNVNDIKLLLSQPLPEDDDKKIQFIKLFKELRNLL